MVLLRGACQQVHQYVSGSVLHPSGSGALLREGVFMTAEEMLLISKGMPTEPRNKL